MSRRRRASAHQATLTMLTHASAIADERHATAILVCGGDLSNRHLLHFDSRLTTIFLLSNRTDLSDRDGSRHVIPIANMPPTRMSRVRLGILLAMSRNLLKPRDLVVSVTGDAGAPSLDTVVVLRAGDELGMFGGRTRQQWESSDLQPDVLERVIELATQLAIEGREGNPVGTLFVVGDFERVVPKTHQMILNPFHGYPAEQRNILDRGRLGETIKEFSTIDGAFLVRGDGTIESAGAYVQSSLLADEHVPQGLGARHRAAAAITAVTQALAVVLSQSTGTVTIFRSGRIVTEIPTPGGGGALPPRRPRPRSGSGRIVIVGGGIAGLSVAWRLAEAGLRVTLLERRGVVSGATTRNQGWLRSGAFVAPDDRELALTAFRSLHETLDFCPECVEPETGSMLYLFTKKATRVRDWTAAWSAAGIPWERMSKGQVLRELPGLDVRRIRSAFRLPDRSIRFDVLLNRIAAAARRAGVEIRTDTPVVRVLERGGSVRGVLTEGGVRVPANLVILAAGAAMQTLLPASKRRSASANTPRLAVIKSHLIAVRPGVGHVPFCLVDQGGFNHLPHGDASVFHSNHWTEAASLVDTAVVPEESKRIRQVAVTLFPERRHAAWNATEWAGVTIDTAPVRGVALGQALRPLVQEHYSPDNLLSVAPGWAVLWPALAEHVLAIVLAKRSGIRTAAPPWM